MHYDKWYFPSSLAQLAAVSHAANHDALVYDGDKYFYKDPATRQRDILIKKQHLYYDGVDNFEHEIWQHFKKVLHDFNPDIVGVSVFTCKLKSAINTLKLVREFNPAIKTCVGGAHVTALPETFVSKDYVDGVFCGFADLTFPEWLEDKCPKGIIRGDSSKIEIYKLPYVRRKSLMFPEYYNSRDIGVVTMNRGCSAKCTFCSNSFMWPGSSNFRTSESIIAELNELLQDWKIGKKVRVGDETFNEVPKEAMRTAKILKDFGLSWEASVRWNIKKDLLEYFMDCGCTEIHIGLESGSDKALRYMRKGCNKRLIREKAKMVNSLGIKWHLFSIAGFPVETVEDIKETMELALEIKPTSISLNSFSPLPGTEDYKRIPGITPEFASTINQLNPNHCFSEHMDLQTFKDIFVKMSKVFNDYNNRSL
tara:strand:+ start:1770 stop:3038 length:1269 start_codon:yes stop_codon:yes gene_type:complete